MENIPDMGVHSPEEGGGISRRRKSRALCRTAAVVGIHSKAVKNDDRTTFGIGVQMPSVAQVCGVTSWLRMLVDTSAELECVTQRIVIGSHS